MELPFDGEPLPCVARGDVFEFHLLPHVRWSSTEMSSATLRERAGLLQEAALVEVLRRAWTVTRGCEAGDPGGVETQINRELGDGWCYTDDEGLISCRPSVRVRIDPSLRDHMRPFVLSEVSMRSEHGNALLRAAQTEALVEEWMQVIARLEMSGGLGPAQRQFLVPFVATLVDRDFAAATGALRDARGSGTLVLAEFLKTAVGNHERIGLFEYANAYDKALSGFCVQMGLSPYAMIFPPSDEPASASVNGVAGATS
ncbi:hypothetical protein [Embleya sp. NPDC050493]|uniref:hypothetical protein n=1 Tax=Embleya sp. NPDC050493 TaxID=3363989 RepID=UPI00378A8A4D